ncbi:MAG: helix-turn-helix transcriptional regulator [Clostridia bacterium]|nr:helix-turn-helix transcriptional regulator [Clostridia bacterium]
MNEDYYIKHFVSAMRVVNKKGHFIEMKCRRNSCIIFMQSGRIEFLFDGKSVVADCDNPIYIPSGASYKNESLSDSAALMINFDDSRMFAEISPLPKIGRVLFEELFSRIESLSVLSGISAKSEIMSVLYELFSVVFKRDGSSAAIFNSAAEYMGSCIGRTDTTVASVAAHLNVSCTYLNRIFLKNCGMTPFKYLTKLRMEKAAAHLSVGFSVGETAELCGYGDIYQFSRAFKKYYSCSPNKMK